MITINHYTYRDENDIIESFKNTLKPKYKSDTEFSDFNKQDHVEFQSIMGWFKENDYFIEQFPNVILQQLNLNAFGVDVIKGEIQKTQTGTTVRWQDRRKLIDSLVIKRKQDFPAFQLNEDIQQIIENILERKGEFYNMTKTEQLATLNNCIEYLLKDGKNFKAVDSSLFYDYINENDIRRFRQETQVFRHHSKESIEERKLWIESKREFYIRLGLIIVMNLNNNSTTESFIF